jgi:hypothetical protein
MSETHQTIQWFGSKSSPCFSHHVSSPLGMPMDTGRMPQFWTAGSGAPLVRGHLCTNQGQLLRAAMPPFPRGGGLPPAGAAPSGITWSNLVKRPSQTAQAAG